jgi:hypothetical protein
VKYQVDWSNLADQFLAAHWIVAPDRNAVTAAANVIDRILASSPNTTGVVVFVTVREYTHGPLGIEFEVIDTEHRVFVLSCWDTATGRPAPTGN